MSARPIVVIGSTAMDLVCRTPRRPAPGETIVGRDFVTAPGGKGANQAVAAARLGGDVHFIGRVGDDDFGEGLLAGLRGHHVNVKHVTVTEATPSGVAMILVDPTGENSIVIVPGANGMVKPADVDAAENLIAAAAVVVLQLEIPLATVSHAIALCQRHGVYTILDPAPVPRKALPRAFFQVDLLTPNQSEAEMLVGETPTHGRIKKRIVDPKQVAGELLARGPNSVVLKLGKGGSLVLDRNDEFYRAKPFKVKVTDTTAAGDAFTGALAVAQTERMPLADAARFANAAGALCCTVFGAQPSLPSRDAVDKLLHSPRR